MHFIIGNINKFFENFEVNLIRGQTINIWGNIINFMMEHGFQIPDQNSVLVVCDKDN